MKPAKHLFYWHCLLKHANVSSAMFCDPLTVSLAPPTGKNYFYLYTKNKSLYSQGKTSIKLIEHIYAPQRMSPFPFGHSMAFLLCLPKGMRKREQDINVRNPTGKLKQCLQIKSQNTLFAHCILAFSDLLT